MKILFISDLLSERVIKDIYERKKNNPNYAVQKFNRLLAKGFISNGCKVTALSNPPITRAVTNKAWVNINNEFESDIEYNYIAFLNFPVIKHLFIFFRTFLYILFWGGAKKNEKVIVCDVLKISGCMGAIAASFINGVKITGIVTDVFNQQVGSSLGIKSRISAFINSAYISSFDYYVLLTEQMNELVNPRQRPFIVMEGLCDNTVTDEQINQSAKVKPKTILYAGGLFVEYGVKMLVDSFISLKRNDAKLVIYGNGPYALELARVAKEYDNIDYRGVALNEDVVKAELEATLLVNPRFSSGEFTKYSFPSKNMEYMTTGTPLLTTKLPGMPQEYYHYVYLFDHETVEGYARCIDHIIDSDPFELTQKGQDARSFVLLNKNNKQQTARILLLMKK